MQVTLPYELLPPRGVEVRGLVGEVQVAAVGEARGVALLPQRAGDGGERRGLGRELHHREERLGREAAQDGHLAAVGAERVGEEVLEPDPLALEPLHVGHNGLAFARGIHHRTAEAFEQHDHHVGALRAEHRIGRIGRDGAGGSGRSGGRSAGRGGILRRGRSGSRRIARGGGSTLRTAVAAQLLEAGGALLLGEEGVGIGIGAVVAQRREEGEERVDGRLVEEHLGAEGHLRDVGHRGADPSADGQEVEAAEQKQHEAPHPAQRDASRREEEPPHQQAVEPDEQRRAGGEEERLADAHPPVDVGQHLLRGVEVHQRRAVEAEAPVFVEGQVDGEDRPRNQRHHPEVEAEDAPPRAVGEGDPEREEREQQRQGGDVARHGHVEREAVPDDPAPVAEAVTGRLGGVVEEEYGFLERHHQGGGAEGGKGEQESLLHGLRYWRGASGAAPVRRVQPARRQGPVQRYDFVAKKRSAASVWRPTEEGNRPKRRREDGGGGPAVDRREGWRNGRGRTTGRRAEAGRRRAGAVDRRGGPAGRRGPVDKP